MTRQLSVLATADGKRVSRQDRLVHSLLLCLAAPPAAHPHPSR